MKMMSPWLPVRALLFEHRDLILQLARREVLERYRGSVLGLVWSFMHPVLMLLVYMFVFGVVFQMKWGVERRSDIEFAVILFSGLVVHGLFAECLMRGPTLVTGNPQFVKKIVFPLHILPVVSVCVALFHMAVGLLILLLATLLAKAHVPATALFLPIVLLPIVVLSLGVSWFLASLGVFLRDVNQVVGILATVLLFLSPIFYPVSAVPEHLQAYLYINPLTLIIEELRNVMIFGRAPDWIALGAYFVVSYLIMVFAVWWFRRTRNAFADVI